jgi:hypothetical protein
MKGPVSIFFGRDQGMAFFLGFLVFITIFVPMVTLSQPGRIVLSFVFTLTLVFGASATIRHRILMYFVVALSLVTAAVDLMGESNPGRSASALETTLKIACLSILMIMTVRQTVRPGPITVYRVMGGIAGYLLIGFIWSYAYDLVMHQIPGAIHFVSGVAGIPARQPTHLMYFSFITLTTVGYGDAYPIHPAARSLVMAEALIGQLYIATLIASLVGMAMRAKSATADVGSNGDVERGQAALPKVNEPKEHPAENGRQ